MREILMLFCIRVYLSIACLMSALLALPLKLWSSEGESPIKPDEQVLFFPTVGRWDCGQQQWKIPIHGWIFEPEKDSFSRRIAKRKLRSVLGLDPQQPETALFERRVHWFLVDNERGKRITIRIAGRPVRLEGSHADGHFEEIVFLPSDALRDHARDGCLPFSAVTRPTDARQFTGVVHLCESTGVSVVSDIDDTIKVSEARDRERLLRRTFLEPFQEVEGMAEKYRQFAAAGARFHYVSACPWQFHQPLATFLKQKNFPKGSFHQKRFRVMDVSISKLFEDPVRYKQAVIDKLFTDFPQRKFFLIGDSGQKDPEVYGILARRYPRQIERIMIRDITQQPRQHSRYQTAFREVAPDKWFLFRHAEQLDSAVLTPSSQQAPD